MSEETNNLSRRSLLGGTAKTAVFAGVAATAVGGGPASAASRWVNRCATSRTSPWRSGSGSSFQLSASPAR